jgi:5-formyltetrahydrofolate cyclo-ligase
MAAMEIRSLRDGLTLGRLGIHEPAGGQPWLVEAIDFIVVPALAFDHRGYRLGRGGGFYDRFLALPDLRAVTCGLGFAEQVVDEVPVAPHDRPVKLLVTDKGVLRF